MSQIRNRGGLVLAACIALSAAAPAHADLVISQLIVDLQPGKQVRNDIEVWNDSPERSFVAIEPREVLYPSSPNQGMRRDPDPQKLGLLVSPTRMILEPGQRKLVRIATLAKPDSREHVYRVTIKPVVGAIAADSTGLKLLVGYDVLVLVRPEQPAPNVRARREGRSLTFTNSGNVSVEIIDGRQCDRDHRQCTPLPGKRLYPGASWTVQLVSDEPADYNLKSPGKLDHESY